MNSRFQFLGWVGLIFFGKMALASSTISISADDLSRLVRSKNQNVSGSEAMTEAARARTGHLVRSYLPTLKAEVGGKSFKTGPHSTMNQPYGEAEVRVNLFRGGKDRLEEKIRQSQTSVAQAEEKKTFEAEITEARKLYWNMVFRREMTTTLKGVLDQNEKYLELANRRISRGLSTETDRLDFEIHRSQLNEEIESLNHELMLLQIQLTAVLGLDSGTQLKTGMKIDHLHDDVLLSSKFDAAKYPEVEALRENFEATAIKKTQTNRWWVPSLDIYGGYYLHTFREREYFFQDLRDDTVLGLKLTFDLFDGLQSKTAANALAYQASGYELQARQRERSVQAQVEVSKEDMKYDHVLIHQSEERIEQGAKYLSRTLDEYGRGVKNSIDVLSAVQRQGNFLRQYAERRRNYQITKSRLLALLGQ